MSSTDSADEVVGENTVSSPKKCDFDVKIKEEILDVYKTEIVENSENLHDDNPVSSPKKRQKKGHFNVEVKETVFNVYKREIEENPEMLLGEIAESVAIKTGICSRSVRKIMKEYETTGTLSAPKAVKNRKNTFRSLCDFEKTAIRKKVHEFFLRNDIPTTVKVLKAVNADPDLPDFKRTTFLKILKKLKFKFQKRRGNSLLLDKDEIRCWRRDYLMKIKKYRTENRKIYYQGETWINAGQANAKVWVEGKNMMICHIGSEDGFLPDALWEFESKKIGKHHEEIDGPSFEKWFSSILPKLEPNSVIVLDNAPYHSRILEKIPTAASRKCDIEEWLLSKNITFNDTMIKPQLLHLINENKKPYSKYIIDEMAKTENKIVLRLPSYHCELNPIEFVWAEMKCFVEENYAKFKFADKNIFYDTLLHITPQKWQECIQHVQQNVELKMWKMDDIMDEKVESLLINSNDDSSTSSDMDSE